MCSPVACSCVLSSGNLFCGAISGTGSGILGVLDRVFLARAVDGDFDRNLSAIDLLAVHVSDRLLLEFLRLKGDKAETSTLAWLVSGLEFLHHESWNWSKGDLSGNRLVVDEKFLQL